MMHACSMYNIRLRIMSGLKMVWSIFNGFSFSFFRNTEFCHLKRLAITAWLSIVCAKRMHASSHTVFRGCSKHRCKRWENAMWHRSRLVVSRSRQTPVHAPRNTSATCCVDALQSEPDKRCRASTKHSFVHFETPQQASRMPQQTTHRQRCFKHGLAVCPHTFFAVCNLKLWRPILMYTFTGESIKARRDFLVQ